MRTVLAITFGFTLAMQAQEVNGDILINSRQTFEFIGGQILGGGTVKGAPYSAEAVNQTTQTLADGNHIVTQTSSMVYRDGEGRERRGESIGRLGVWDAEGEPAQAIFISDPVAKVSYTLDAKTHTAQKIPGSIATSGTIRTVIEHGPLPPLPSPSGPAQVFIYKRRESADSSKSARKIENLGTRTIEGLQAEGTRVTITIPAGQIGNEREINIVSERWFSPELQITVLSKYSDPRSGETVHKLANLKREEPPHSMFEVPADYTITESPMMRVHSNGKDQDQD